MTGWWCVRFSRFLLFNIMRYIFLGISFISTLINKNDTQSNRKMISLSMQLWITFIWRYGRGYRKNSTLHDTPGERRVVSRRVGVILTSLGGRAWWRVRRAWRGRLWATRAGSSGWPGRAASSAAPCTGTPSRWCTAPSCSPLALFGPATQHPRILICRT